MDRIAKALFYTSLAIALFVYGTAVGRFEIFPYGPMSAMYIAARAAINEMTSSFYRIEKNDVSEVSFHEPEQTSQGLRLITRVGADEEMLIEIIDTDFTVVHQWVADWHALWPDAAHVPAELLPQNSRGMHVHGAVVMPNGDVVFNFEHLGLICLDLDGKVRWRLAYRTHHSVTYGPEGSLWVCGQKRATEPQPSFPHREPPYDEYTILKVSPEGELLKEYSVQGILHRNGYNGVIPSLPRHDKQGLLHDDRLHLNDVEPFPQGMKPGYFGPGDVVVSLRNPGIIFVFNTSDERIKFFHYGVLVRQHDPDFIDGDTLLIFDNRPAEQYGPGAKRLGSRIVTLSAEGDDSVEVLYEGGVDGPFHTPIMGKQQLLRNGNLLITESRKGRAFEVTPDRKIVWQYINKLSPNEVGQITEVSQLPENISKFFQDR